MINRQKNNFSDLIISGRHIFCLGIMLLWYISVFSACERINSNKGNTMLNEALSDFEFVGVGPYVQESTPPHGIVPLPLPIQFRSGNQYVFHLYKTGRNSDVYKMILNRFQSADIQIRSATNSMDRYVGGPGFRIEFQANSLKGFVVNRLDGQILNDEKLLRAWSLDDYIVVLEKD